MSVYQSACYQCLDRNTRLPDPEDATQYWFWCVRDASCRRAQVGQMGACEDRHVGTDCIQYEDYSGREKKGGIGLNCDCTDCADGKCVQDYVDPSCKPLYTDCGCGHTATDDRRAGNDPTKREWTRGELACEFSSRKQNSLYPGTSAFVSTEKLDMRRKAETLLHQRNSARLTSKQKWSQMVRGKGPLGPKAWASQTQTVTTPNTRPCGASAAACGADPTNPACGGCLPPNPKKPATSLLCTGPPPSTCSPNTSADVPRSPILEQNLICMDKSVPLTRYGRPNVVLSTAGTKWPGGGWAPGDAGFPVGKAGSNAYERELAAQKLIQQGASLENQSFKINLPYFPGGAGGQRTKKLTRCNRFAVEGVSLTVCVRDGIASVPDLTENDVAFWWRPSDRLPWDPNGVGRASGAGESFSETVGGGNSRPFATSSCTAEPEWGGFGWLEDGPDEEGPPGGPPIVNEPGEMTSWCQSVLALAVRPGSAYANDGLGATSSLNSSTCTCCGAGELLKGDPYGGAIGDGSSVPIGTLRYTGALVWATDFKQLETAAGVDVKLTAPEVYSPWGPSTWHALPRPLEASPYCDPGKFVKSDGPWRGSAGSGLTAAPSMLSLTDWAVYAGPNSKYQGRGCGQPLTVSKWGPPTQPSATAAHELYDCKTVPSCPTFNITNSPTYGAAGAPPNGWRKAEYTEQFGGAWSPAVYACDTNDEQTVASSLVPEQGGASLSADGRYITITWNFGAFCNTYPTSGDCPNCLDNTGVAGLESKEGGMGAWAAWVAPGAGTLDDPAHQGRGGMVPELYSFTWYIEIESLAAAVESQVTVPCYGVVTGKPSSGPLIDPRPSIGGYASEDNSRYIDINRAGGGWLGPGGSVVGTRAGGLGVRGCVKEPVCDVWATKLSIELCE